MVPAIPLRCDQQFARLVIESVERFARVHVVFRGFTKQSCLLSGVGINGPDLFRLESALVIVVENCLVVRRPFETRAVLKWQLDWLTLNINPFARFNIEDDRFSLRKHLARQGIYDGIRLWPELAGRHKLNAGEAARISGIDAVGYEFG